METIKNFFKSTVGILTTIIGVLLAALKISSIFRKNAESKLETAEANAKSAVMDSKIEATKEEQKKLEANIDSLSKNHEKEVEANQNKSNEDIESFYKQKK